MLGTRHVVLDRAPGVAGLLEVHGQHESELARALRVQRFQGRADPPMEFATLLLEQRRVGRVLDEAGTGTRGSGRIDASRMRPFASRTSTRVVVVTARLDHAFQHSHRELAAITAAAEAALRIVGQLVDLASSSPCSVSGISIEATSAVATQRVPSCTIAPRSMSIRTTSSTKNGLPSDLARIRSRTRAGQRFDLQQVGHEGLAVGLREGAGGSSVSASPEQLPRVADEGQPGASVSARIAATKRMGSWLASGMSWRASMDARSAQWMSSQTATRRARPAHAGAGALATM